MMPYFEGTWRIGAPAEQLFRQTCQNALTQSQFQWIKRNPVFAVTVGGSDATHAVSCYRFVVPYADSGSLKLKDFAINDTIAGDQLSKKIPYSGSTLSNNLWRNAESVQLIANNFNLNASSSIIEIGAGIGTLAACINIQWPQLNSYTIIDLPEVANLSLKYNKTVNSASIVDIANPPVSASLVITEYSISELDDNTFGAYYDTYIRNANGLFARFNFMPSDRLSKWIAVIQKDFSSVSVVPEATNRGTLNKIVIAKK